MQNRTGLSLRRVLRALKPLRSATVQVNGVTSTFPVALTPEAPEILDALNRPDARH